MTPGAGSAPLLTMVKSLSSTTHHKEHVKFVGLQNTTVARYKKSISRFFEWMEVEQISTPESWTELDDAAGEYVNYLYLDDRPIGWALDFVSGMKRLCPKCKLHLPTAGTYNKNWAKSLKRTRALPMPPDILIALCTLSILRGERKLCAVLLLGFLGLLRSGELVLLTRGQLTFLSGNSTLVIALPESKGAKRSGQPENVIVSEAPVVQFIHSVAKDLEPGEVLYKCSHASLGVDIRRLSSMLGLHHPNLTPYTLRRGGATWLYQQTLNFDVVQHKGRWSEARTCKIYVNTATAEIGRASLPEWGSSRVKQCSLVFTTLLKNPALGVAAHEAS